MNKVLVLVPILGTLAAFYWVMSDQKSGQVSEAIAWSRNAMSPKGIRNNNPGNIEDNPRNQWRGQVGDDGRFAIFDTPVNGIRALARLLFNYNKIYGLSTVSGIINRWAPDSENNTSSYVADVSNRLGVHPQQRIDLAQMMPGLVKAIIRHENGQQPYTETQIDAGIAAV